MELPREVALREIPWVTPTMNEELLLCPLRAGFRSDPSFRVMRHPSLPASLGTISHKLAERTAKGHFDAIEVEALADVLAGEWEGLVQEEYERLLEAAQFGTVPDPARWPGYQLLRVRTLKRLSEELKSRSARSPIKGMLTIEQRLEDKSTRVAGSPDRVERSESGVEIVDLKTGWRVGDELRPSHRRQLLIYAYLWHVVHGEWPVRASVQRLDGTRQSFDVDPNEATLEAREASRSLTRFNDIVSSGVGASTLADPSEESCWGCDYQGACDAFLSQANEKWPGRRRTLAGAVSAVQNVGGGSTIDLVDVVGGCGMPFARMVVSGQVPKVAVGSWCMLSDAVRVTDTDFRVDWETRLFVRAG